MALVIVLNGTSSSGKTTLARALQNCSERVLLNFSIDNILYSVPQRLFERMTTGEELGEIAYGSLVEAYYGCVRKLADLGLSLISDNAVTTRVNAERLAHAVSGHDVLLVGVDCSVETAEARERAREDRRRGLARMQTAGIHRWLAYDLMVNTDSTSAEENAMRILQVVAAGTRGAFEETLRRLNASGSEVLPRS